MHSCTSYRLHPFANIDVVLLLIRLLCRLVQQFLTHIEPFLPRCPASFDLIGNVDGTKKHSADASNANSGVSNVTKLALTVENVAI